MSEWAQSFRIPPSTEASHRLRKPYKAFRGPKNVTSESLGKRGSDYLWPSVGIQRRASLALRTHCTHNQSTAWNVEPMSARSEDQGVIEDQSLAAGQKGTL